MSGKKKLGSWAVPGQEAVVSHWDGADEVGPTILFALFYLEEKIGGITNGAATSVIRSLIES